MNDSEVIDADLFRHTGLADLPLEDKTEFIQEFGRLLGVAGLLIAGAGLSDKDQDKLLSFLGDGEEERAMAFLASRNVDLEDIISKEAIRIKRPLIESDRKMNSLTELITAVKAQFAPAVLEIDYQRMGAAISEVHEYIDSLPFSNEQKLRLADSVTDQASQKVEDYVRGVMAPDIMQQAMELMDQEKIGSGLQLFLSNGVDLVELNIKEAMAQGAALRERFQFLEEDPQ